MRFEPCVVVTLVVVEHIDELDTKFGMICHPNLNSVSLSLSAHKHEYRANI